MCLFPGCRLKECAPKQQQQQGRDGCGSRARPWCSHRGDSPRHSLCTPGTSQLSRASMEPQLQFNSSAGQTKLYLMPCEDQVWMPEQHLAQNCSDLKDADFHYHSPCAFLPSHSQRHKSQASPAHTPVQISAHLQSSWSFGRSAHH